MVCCYLFMVPNCLNDVSSTLFAADPLRGTGVIVANCTPHLTKQAWHTIPQPTVNRPLAKAAGPEDVVRTMDYFAVPA